MPGYTAVADTIAFRDTVMLNYHDVDVQQLYSLSSTMNGNVLVSPIQSRVINHRQKTIDDPFAWCGDASRATIFQRDDSLLDRSIQERLCERA